MVKNTRIEFSLTGFHSHRTSVAESASVMRFLPFLLLALLGCSRSENTDIRPQGDLFLSASTPSAEGFNLEKMTVAFDTLERDPHYDFLGIVVLKNRHLVVERYFNGHHANALHDMRSVAKSFTSALMGIAIEESVIDGIEVEVLDLFSSYAPYKHDDQKKHGMTIKHLLSMASGFDADVEKDSSPGHEDWLWESKDWLRFTLDLPMANLPGEKWSYASVNTFLAGAAIEESTGQQLATFARRKLFEPLGISNFEWAETPTGRTVAQGNLSITARDAAKFGQLYLDGGRWGDLQIVPESWINASVKPSYPVPWVGYDNYGYGWYTHSLTIRGRQFDYYLASGNGGNKIYVFPHDKLVVVMQSAAYNSSYGQRRSLELLKSVLDALQK